MLSARAYLAAFAVATTVAFTANSASAAFLAIDDTAGSKGKLNYSGASKVVEGAVGFSSIEGVGTPLRDGTTIACPSCVLTFTTGTLISGSTFGPGGSFELTSGRTSLLSATFTGAEVSPDGTGLDFIGHLTSVSITYAPLAAYFGIAPHGSGLLATLVTTKGRVLGADLFYTPVPVPAALPLFLSGLAGFGLISRRSAS